MKHSGGADRGTHEAQAQDASAKGGASREPARGDRLSLKPVSAQKRFLILASIMIAACGVGMSVMIAMIYFHDIADHREQLRAIARNRASLIEAVARYDSKAADIMQEADPDHDPGAATLGQVLDAHEHGARFGGTGELVLARRDGDVIDFLGKRRFGAMDHPAPVSLDSDFAEPMRRALEGKSGTLVGLDYRGRQVLAAYEPVPMLNLAIVAKVDMAEIRAPLIKTTLTASAIAIVVVLVATVIFFRIANPIVGKLEAYSRNLEKEIEERKQVETALRESELRSRVLLEDSPACTKIISLDSKLQYMSAAGQAMIKVPDITPYYGSHYPPDFYPESAKIVLSEAVERAKAGEIANVDSRVVDIEGGEVWFNSTFVPARDDDGHVAYVIGTSIDITARKQAEESLKQHEYYLSKAQEIGLIGTWELDIATNALVWTDETYRIVGVSVGTPLNYELFLSRVHPEDREYVDRKWTAALNREPYDIEHRLLVDGKVKWVRTKAELVYDDDGKAVKAIGFTQDITAQKKAERKLQESEQRFRTLVEHAPDGIFLFDVALGRFVEANPTVQALLGYTRDDLLRMHWIDISAPIQPGDLRAEICGEEMVQEALTGTPVVGEWLFLDRNGKEVLTELRLNFLKSGNRQLLRASLTDITLRKQAEREREQLITRLESQNVELEQFAYTVSHDLKSPLITIGGYAGMLRQDLDQEDAAAVEKDLERISTAAEKMAHLLDNVLELSRIGRLVNASQDVSLDELVRESLTHAHGPVEKRGVQVEVASDLPVVFGDRLRLREVVQNLIENSVKYMGDQPDPRIEIGTRRDGNETVCYVRDNGIGIDPRYHERVFRLFDQLDAAAEGSGIGLSLVKRIIEVHGGRIWVESEGLGRGTTFCFTLGTKGESVSSSGDIGTGNQQRAKVPSESPFPA